VYANVNGSDATLTSDWHVLHGMSFQCFAFTSGFKWGSCYSIFSLR